MVFEASFIKTDSGYKDDMLLQVAVHWLRWMHKTVAQMLNMCDLATLVDLYTNSCVVGVITTYAGIAWSYDVQGSL